MPTLGERLRPPGWLGIAISFAEVAVIVVGQGRGLQVAPDAPLALLAAALLSVPGGAGAAASGVNGAVKFVLGPGTCHRILHPRVAQAAVLREGVREDLGDGIGETGDHVVAVQHDYGIDLVVFSYDANGEIEPGQIYVQLKATDHPTLMQTQQVIAFPIKRADLELWLDEPMPYILILYDARADIAYWLYVQAYFARLPGFRLADVADIVSVHFQTANVVSEAAIMRFAFYKNDLLRQVKERGKLEHHE